MKVKVKSFTDNPLNESARRFVGAFLYGKTRENKRRMGKMYENYQAKEGALEFYGSRKWKKCRRNYLSEHPICERCSKLGIVKRAEIVHHKIYLDTEKYKDPEVALNFDNLEALCWDCHFAEHHKNSDCRAELYFDADGNLRKG